jgi:cytochrome b6-f complex iron-sulfur subunit
MSIDSQIKDSASFDVIWMSRRSFLYGALMLCGAAISAEIACALGRLFSPSDSGAESQPVSLKLSDLKPNRAVQVRCGDQPVLVIRYREGDREELLAYSAVCTHLGCLVSWMPSREAKKISNMKSGYIFYCPCHDGAFGPHGEVLAGPAPLPLEKVEITVRNDTIIVGGIKSGAAE